MTLIYSFVSERLTGFYLLLRYEGATCCGPLDLETPAILFGYTTYEILVSFAYLRGAIISLTPGDCERIKLAVTV